MMWLIGAPLLLFFIALLFMHKQIRPIQRLATAADRFGKGLPSQKFKPEGSSEIRKAGKAFTVMRDRIHKQVGQRTEMLAAVSHDLRTPLTRMKLQLAMMGENDGVDNLHTDIKDMEKTVEEFLSFARGDYQESPKITDISLILNEICQTLKRDHIKVTLNIAQPISVEIREHSFKRCLVNVISNAVHYGTRVWIDVKKTWQSYTIYIDDDGPGIPIAERKNVLKPFYRIESSRNTDTGGSGLGLAIAHDIITTHGGDIDLLDSPKCGLRVRIKLPI